MRSRLAIVILTAITAALATVMPTAGKSAPANVCDCSNIHTVAVMSGIGQGLRLEKENFFRQSSKTLKIDDWAVDDQVESTVRTLLSSRFEFKKISYDHAALAKVASGMLDNKQKEITKFLGTVDKEGIDAFIILRPELNVPSPGRGGLSIANDVTDDGRPVATANYEIHIVDARTFKILATIPSLVRLRAGKQELPALVLAKQLAFNEETMIPTPEQFRAYRAVFYKLIPLSLLETVRSLQMGVPLPPAGARSLVDRSPDMRVYGRIRSVAVISTLGDDFLLQHFGDGNIMASSDHLNIDDWRLDDVIEATAREAVGTAFEVKNVPVDRTEVGKSRLLDDKLAFNPQLRGLSPADEVDAYLVFLKHPFTFRESRTRGQGAGMVRFFGLFHSDTIVFMYYDVALIDARTLKVIRASSAAIDPAFSNTSPSLGVPAELWPDSADKTTAGQKDKLRGIVMRLLGQSEKETLLRMDLTNKMIVDSWPLPVVDAIETNTL